MFVLNELGKRGWASHWAMGGFSFNLGQVDLLFGLVIRLVDYCKTTSTKFVTKLKIEGPSLPIFRNSTKDLTCRFIIP